jgi:hypothetical protein
MPWVCGLFRAVRSRLAGKIAFYRVPPRMVQKYALSVMG